ncbi:unnamed protein product [Linum trigynum]|uniref:Uncharacterized protein n=1 Tax=Linum trigynum TaxID=586398 RepID=A0AAV2CZ83_9ROSI
MGVTRMFMEQSRGVEAKEPVSMIHLPSKKNNHSVGDWKKLPHTKKTSLHKPRRNSSWNWQCRPSWGVPQDHVYNLLWNVNIHSKGRNASFNGENPTQIGS